MGLFVWRCWWVGGWLGGSANLEHVLRHGTYVSLVSSKPAVYGQYLAYHPHTRTYACIVMTARRNVQSNNICAYTLLVHFIVVPQHVLSVTNLSPRPTYNAQEATGCPCDGWPPSASRCASTRLSVMCGAMASPSGRYARTRPSPTTA